jgi:phage tail-like protein
MCGSVDGLRSAVDVIGLLPSIYQDDEFTRQFVSGFDDVLAPVFITLDSLEAYVDPHLTPDDFLPWLASWVGVVLAEDWPVERQRALVANAVHIYRYRGTAMGLRAELQLYTGGEVEINETGGCVWSQRPNGDAFPGEDVPRVAIRVTVADRASVSDVTVDSIVAAAKPAHVVHSIEIVERGEQAS